MSAARVADAAAALVVPTYAVLLLVASLEWALAGMCVVAGLGAAACVRDVLGLEP